MFKNTLRQWRRALLGVRLRAEEKKALRDELVQFMQQHPVRIDTPVRHIWQLRRQTPRVLLLNQRYMIATIILALTLALGSGAYAAEQALPGDVLYPVKININEEIKVALAPTAAAKAEAQSKRVERRLEEAAILSLEGNLSKETEEKIAERITDHAAELEAVLSRVAEKNPNAAIEVRADIEARITASEKVLKHLRGSHEIKIRIRSALDVLSSATTTLSSDLGVRATSTGSLATMATSSHERDSGKQSANFARAAREKRRAAEHKINEVRKYLAKIEERSSAAATAEARTRLMEAEQTVVSGDAQFEAKAYREAFRLYQQGHQMAQEAKLLIKLEQRMHVILERVTSTAGTVSGTIDIKLEVKEKNNKDQARKEEQKAERREAQDRSQETDEQRKEERDNEDRGRDDAREKRRIEIEINRNGTRAGVQL